MKNKLIAILRRTLATFGLEIHSYRGLRTSMAQTVRHLKAKGFNPATVIDGGVAYGTPGLLGEFTNCKYLLVEPLYEFESHILALSKNLAAVYETVALGQNEGEVTVSVNKRLTGSSIYQNLGEPEASIEKRVIPMRTLDGLCEKHGLVGPYLIKLDVEGAEIKAMKGASSILRETEVAILEVTFIAKLEGAAEFGDVIAFMAEKGFVVYDIVNMRNSGSTDNLSQADIVFVRRESQLRNKK